MYLIVGLGNPGEKYRNNRHNIGFMAIEQIALKHDFPPFKKKYNGLFSNGKIDSARVILLKPQTFMNRSGASVGAVVSFFKIPPENIIVFYDELDLPTGKLRIKINGGNGGHNGLRSIDSIIGKNYRRVRMGIGHPGHKDKVTSHVLGNFANSDSEWLEPLLDSVSKNISLLLEGKNSQFMNKIALAVFGNQRGNNSKKNDNSDYANQPIKQQADNIKKSQPNQMANKLKNFFGLNKGKNK